MCMSAEDFLAPSSKRLLAVKCAQCPAYADPMKCVEVSERKGDGVWDENYERTQR